MALLLAASQRPTVTSALLRHNVRFSFDSSLLPSLLPPSSPPSLQSLAALRFAAARSPLTSESEAADLIAAATLPTKRQHMAALEAALREVEQENASLQEQYLAAQPALVAASAEIAACKALVEKTGMACEQWRVANIL